MHQLIAGIICIPLGAIVAWASLFADPNFSYPYFAILGVVVVGFGIALLGRALFGFAGLAGKPKATPLVAGQVPYTGPAQYPQQPYGQPQYPPQVAQPYAAQPPYPQQPYAQPQAPQQPYEQMQYPQQ